MPHIHEGTYTSASFWLLLVGVILIFVSIFVPSISGGDVFKLGVGLSFASFLAP